MQVLLCFYLDFYFIFAVLRASILNGVSWWDGIGLDYMGWEGMNGVVVLIIPYLVACLIIDLFILTMDEIALC